MNTERLSPTAAPPVREGRPRIAYLLSRYPATSHTFILREAIELRRLGWRIESASINSPGDAGARAGCRLCGGHGRRREPARHREDAHRRRHRLWRGGTRGHRAIH